MTKNKPNIIYILADDMGYGDIGCNNPDSKISTPNLDCLAQQGMRFTDAHAPSSVCSPSRYSILTGRYCWRTWLKRGVLYTWDPPLIEPNRLTVAGLLRKHGYRTACIGKWHLGWEWATHDGEPASKGTEGLPRMGSEMSKHDHERRHALERNIDYSRPMRGGPTDCGFDSYFGVDVPNFPPYTWFEQDRLTDTPTEEKPEEMFGLPGLMKPGWELEGMIPEFVRRAKDYISEADSDPFFLYLPLTSPHTPIVPNSEFIGKSDAGLYGDFVCEVDWLVGEIMAALKRKGIADDTLLIFASDNGPECHSSAAGGCYQYIKEFDHYSMAHLRGVKRDTWEGGHRVPFIARWPSVTPDGAVCDQLISLGDLIATSAQITDSELEDDEGEDSVSILPLLRGETEAAVREFTVHHSASGRFAIRKGDWVFIDSPSGDDNQEPEWFKKERGYTLHGCPGELFNLRDDIAERRNLYREHPEIVAELSRLLDTIRGADHAKEQNSMNVTYESE